MLTYTFDANGNRASIGYPGGATASYTFDFGDREQGSGGEALFPYRKYSGYLPGSPSCIIS
jgi:hypothetical protein